MKSVAILTDSTVQFTLPTFPGRELVHIIPISVEIDPLHRLTKAQELPNLPSSTPFPRLVLPNEVDLEKFLQSPETNRPYDQVLGIFSSSYLSILTPAVQSLASQWMGRCYLQVIDSLTTSVGLGVVVQAAAEALSRSVPFESAEQIVRSQIPRIYSILCTPNLSYLYHSGIIDVAQATVGEMMGMIPVFVIEEGKLSPLEKVKNYRQVSDLFQEFMDEFDHLKHIAYLQGVNASPQMGRLLREHAAATQSRVPFTEHHINLSLAGLLGPQCCAVTVIEAE